MATSSIKKFLLAGTALVAATVISTQAYAAAVPVALDGTLSDDTWAGAGSGTQTGLAKDAKAGDGPVSLNAHLLTVTNNQTANDGSANKDTFSIGVVNNNTAGAGLVSISQDATGTTNPFSVTITGITNGGAGANNLSIANNDTSGKNMAVSIGASGLALGGGLTITNNGATSTNQALDLTVTGVTNVTGNTLLTAGTGSGDEVSITNTGNATYHNMVLGSGSAAVPNAVNANATVTLNGASNSVGLVDLSDSGLGTAHGEAILNLGPGVTSTTVTNDISGNDVNQSEGVVNLLGSNTVTGTIGATNSVYAVTAGIQGTTSSITGSVRAKVVGVQGLADGAAGSITFGNTLTVGSLGLLVQSGGTTTAQAESATVTGNTSVTGTTDVFAGSHTGANASLTLNGAANTLSGVTNLTANTTGTTASLTLNGAANTLTGLVTLTDAGVGAAGGQAVVTFGSANTTDTLTAGITGAAANEGTVNLLGSNVITGAIGTTNAVNAVNGGVQGQTASISGAVNAQTVTVTGVNDVAATGALNFGNTLTVGTGGLTVSSAGATTAQVESSTITGTLTDAGTLNVTAAAHAGADASLTLNGATNTITGVTTLTDIAAGGNATLNVGAGSAVTFTGGIVGASNNEGTLAFAGSSTVNGTVGSATNALKSITLAGGGTDTFTGNIFSTTIAYGASNSIVQIADGANITGTITATNTGTLTLLGSSTISGQVGAGGATLTTINAGAASGNTDTFNNPVFATTLNVGTGSVSLKDDTTTNLVFGAAGGTTTLASGKTLTGNINGTGGTTVTGIGNLILAGTNTITGQIGNTGILNALTLSGVGVTDTVTSAGATVNAANTTTLGANTLAVGTNNFTLAAGQTLASTITSNTTYGSVTSTGTTTVDPAAKVNLTVSAAGYLPTTTFILVDGGAGNNVGTLAAGGLTVNGVNDGAAQTLTLGAITYSQVGAGTDQLEILATNNGAASVASTPNNKAVAQALDTIAGTGNAALQTVQSHIATASTAGAVNAILGALTPTVDGGTQTVSMAVANQVRDITDTRMNALRAEDGTTGVSAGASDNGVAWWVQGYGENETQNERDAIAGYKASTWGSAIGMDTENLFENGLFGFAFNYGKATVNSDNLNTTTTDVSSYGLTLYGVGALENSSFVEGQVGYGYNKIDSTRHNVGGLAGVDADGSTHSTQYGFKAAYGRDFERWLISDVTVTPEVSTSYTHLNTQGYTETGPGANLVVSGNSQNNMDIGLGTKLAWAFRNQDGSVLKPAVRADYSYAVLDDRIDTTANFAGAAPGTNPTFTTEGPTPERNSLDLGVGVTYLSSSNWDLTANYTFLYRPDYKANAGTLRLTAHF